MSDDAYRPPQTSVGERDFWDVPDGLDEVVGRGVALATPVLGGLVLLALLLYVPGQILGSASVFVMPDATQMGTAFNDEMLRQLGIIYGLSFLITVVGWFATALWVPAAAYLALETRRGGQPTLGQALGYSVRRLPRMITHFGVAQILVGIGTMFCLLPGVYLAWRLAFVGPLVALGHHQGSFDRSAQMAQRTGVTLLLLLAGFWVVGAFLGGVNGFGGQLLSQTMGPSGSVLVGLLAAPLFVLLQGARIFALLYWTITLTRDEDSWESTLGWVQSST